MFRIRPLGVTSCVLSGGTLKKLGCTKSKRRLKMFGYMTMVKYTLQNNVNRAAFCIKGDEDAELQAIQIMRAHNLVVNGWMGHR